MMLVKKNDRQRFAVEAPLGRLAKWLRILGFDTIRGAHPGPEMRKVYLEEDRILISPISRYYDKYPEDRRIRITSDDLLQQLKQVVATLSLTRKDINLFTRCVFCNCPVVLMEKENAYGRVPDYVWETQDIYRQCQNCQRIYWSGTHMKHASEVLDALFGQAK